MRDFARRPTGSLKPLHEICDFDLMFDAHIRDGHLHKAEPFLDTFHPFVLTQRGQPLRDGLAVFRSNRLIRLIRFDFPSFYNAVCVTLFADGHGQLVGGTVLVGLDGHRIILAGLNLLVHPRTCVHEVPDLNFGITLHGLTRTMRLGTEDVTC